MLLSRHDAVMDEEVPELAELLQLTESIQWGDVNGGMPYLGNPVEVSTRSACMHKCMLANSTFCMARCRHAGLSAACQLHDRATV